MGTKRLILTTRLRLRPGRRFQPSIGQSQEARHRDRFGPRVGVYAGGAAERFAAEGFERGPQHLSALSEGALGDGLKGLDEAVRGAIGQRR